MLPRSVFSAIYKCRSQMSSTFPKPVLWRSVAWFYQGQGIIERAKGTILGRGLRAAQTAWITRIDDARGRSDRNIYGRGDYVAIRGCDRIRTGNSPRGTTSHWSEIDPSANTRILSRYQSAGIDVQSLRRGRKRCAVFIGAIRRY